MHSVAAAAEYWPLAQFGHEEALASEYLPAAQLMQLLCPVEPWYSPAMQVVHAVRSPAVPYWPDGQLAQTDVPVVGAILPRSHSAQEVKPTLAEYFPTPHEMQALEPVRLAYLPAAQPVHEDWATAFV